MKKKILALGFALSLIISACGGTPSEEDLSMVATSAAQTVEARFTQQAEKTATPEPVENVEEATPTFTPTPTETPVPGVAPEGCLVATFVGETIPDGTVIGIGEYFTKSWSIRNDGTCTWHKGYKLIYWSGDRLGSAFEYEFFEDTPPGQIMSLPIQLLAPDTPGSYGNEWKFKSPSGYVFGVGEYNAPITANVAIANPDDIKKDIGITSVVYSLDREPDFGCPTNVHWNINATITVSGKMTVVAQFLQSDGNHTPKETLFFEEAGSQTISMDWTLHKGAGPAPRSVQVSISKPDKITYPTYTFVNNCPDQVD
ncbi:MAG: hypothetical protein GY755_22775 [Chloroflexi bacterium]|nr:hypothetical protein [Chloroflexota bacterium]